MGETYVSFAAVKRVVTLEAVLARYDLLKELTPKGENLAGQCPLCEPPRGRSFRVSLSKNAWFCFGCKKGGNVLDFVAAKEKATLRVAAGKLVTWFGLRLGTESTVTDDV